MGIFDIFTGDSVKKAAEKQRAFLDEKSGQSKAYIDDALTKSLGFTTSGYGNARGALTTGYNTGTGAVNSGADLSLAALDSGVTGALDRVDAARGAATQPLTALGGKYGTATQTYLNALGVNGADGAASARAAFTPSLSYDFTLDQGIDAVNRRRAAGGMLASGNADRDAQDYAMGMASKESNAWLDRLAGFVNPELAATTSASGIERDLGLAGAGFVNTAGQNRAGVESSRGAMLADLASRYGTGTAANYVGEGTTLAGLTTNAAGAKAGVNTGMQQPYANTYAQEGQAEMAGSGNLWNLGLNLLKMGTGAAGGMGGR